MTRYFSYYLKKKLFNKNILFIFIQEFNTFFAYFLLINIYIQKYIDYFVKNKNCKIAQHLFVLPTFYFVFIGCHERSTSLCFDISDMFYERKEF